MDHYHTLSCRRPATEDRENKNHDQDESVKEHFIFPFKFIVCTHSKAATVAVAGLAYSLMGATLTTPQRPQNETNGGHQQFVVPQQ